MSAVFQGLEKNRRLFSKAWKTGAWALGVAAALAPEAAFAPVFRAVGGANHGATTANQPGWTRAYRAELEINGGRGELEVLGVSMPAAAALETLRATYAGMGGEAEIFPGETAGWGIARAGDRVIRFLAVSPQGPRECLVFRFEQSRADFERSLRGADGAAFAGGRERRVAAESGGRFEARTIETGAEPAAASAAIARAHIAEGWRPALPDAPGAGLFVRGPDVCVVRVSARPAPEVGSRALIARQRLGSE